jgi:filamentous hemagglutinin family protein
VPKAGVNLLNQSANASTILNQVTSNNRSYLNGPLAVVGPTAHVIVANPSGITVDGGSFINTGGVALTAGSVSFVNSAMNIGMQNVMLGTGTGDILITGMGLAGSMTNLQLIAGRIKVDGPIINTLSDPNASINIVTGNANVMLDSSVMPGSTLTPWALTSLSGGASGDILIDITPNGSISASRVSMVVGAQGAGVSFQGSGLASIGEFTIDAGGKVAILDGQIQAEKSIKITASAIDVTNDGTRITQLSSIASDVTLLAFAGDMNITGQIVGYQRNGADPDSKGAVTLAAKGDITLFSRSASQLALVFASADDLSVTAGGNITNNTGRLLSNSRVFIEAQGNLNNTEDITGGDNTGAPVTVTTSRSVWWWPWANRTSTTTTYEYGSLRIPEQLAYISGGSVFIKAGNVINAGNILAQNGSLQIDTGLFENFGSVTGSASFSRSCFIFCSSSGTSTVESVTVNGNPAGMISSAGSMQINASNQLINLGGTILSEGNLALNSPSIIATGFSVPLVAQIPGGIYNGFGGPTAFLYQAPIGGLFMAPNGHIDVTTDEPVQINGGALQAATGVNNPAGTQVTAPASGSRDSPNLRIGVFEGLW